MKTKKYLLFTLSSILSVALFVTIGASQSITSYMKAEVNDDKVLVLDNLNAPTTETEYQTEVVYSGVQYATFTYSKVKADAGKLCKLNVGGSIVKDEAKGLSSINVVFSGALKAVTSFTAADDTTEYTLTNNVTSNICGNYISIVATEESSIEQITLCYSCLTDHKETKHIYSAYVVSDVFQGYKCNSCDHMLDSAKTLYVTNDGFLCSNEGTINHQAYLQNDAGQPGAWIKWTFNAAQAQNNVALDLLVGSRSTENIFDDIKELYFNGDKVSLGDVKLPYGEEWGDMRLLKLGDFNLAQGENEVKIVAKTNYGYNYGGLYFENLTTTITGVDKYQGQTLELGTPTDGPNYFPGDNPSYPATASSPEKAFVDIKGYTGEMQSLGKTFNYPIVSSVNQKVKVKFVVAGANGYPTFTSFNDMFVVKNNGTVVPVPSVVDNPNNRKYVYFTSVQAEIDLVEGLNLITVSNIQNPKSSKVGSLATNFSGIIVKASESGNTLTVLDDIPGKKTFNLGTNVEMKGLPSNYTTTKIQSISAVKFYQNNTIGYFGPNSAQSANYIVNVSKAVSSASFTLNIALYNARPAEESNPNNLITVKVNDNVVTFNESTFPGITSRSYENYHDLTFSVDLINGDNTVQIIPNNAGTNLKTMTVDPTDEVFVNTKIPYKTEFRLEAEAFVSQTIISGTETFTSPNPVLSANSSCSGGYVVAWTAAGNTMTYKVMANKAGVAEFAVRICSGSKSNLNSYGCIRGYINTVETPQANYDTTVLALGDWDTYYTAKFTAEVTAGTNTLMIDLCIGENIDYIDIKGATDNTMVFCEDWTAR